VSSINHTSLDVLALESGVSKKKLSKFIKTFSDDIKKSIINCSSDDIKYQICDFKKQLLTNNKKKIEKLTFFKIDIKKLQKLNLESLHQSLYEYNHEFFEPIFDQIINYSLCPRNLSKALIPVYLKHKDISNVKHQLESLYEHATACKGNHQKTHALQGIVRSHFNNTYLANKSFKKILLKNSEHNDVALYFTGKGSQNKNNYWNKLLYQHPLSIYSTWIHNQFVEKKDIFKGSTPNKIIRAKIHKSLPLKIKKLTILIESFLRLKEKSIAQKLTEYIILNHNNLSSEYISYLFKINNGLTFKTLQSLSLSQLNLDIINKINLSTKVASLKRTNNYINDKKIPLELKIAMNSILSNNNSTKLIPILYWQNYSKKPNLPNKKDLQNLFKKFNVTLSL